MVKAMQTSLFTMSLVSAEIIAPEVKHFVIKPTKDCFTYTPGQFFTIHIETQGKTYKRSYSIANYPDTSAQLEFAASFVANGIASKFLFDLKIGDKLNIAG